MAAAVEMLRSKGYAGFRVEDVALAAGVSRGAQTHHFPTKDSLVLAAIEQIFSAARERSLKQIAALRPGQSVMQAMLEDAEAFFLGPYFPVAMDMLNVGDRGPKFREEIQRISREHRLPVERAWTDLLVSNGISQADAEDLLWLNYSLVRGLAVRRLMQEDAGRTSRVLTRWTAIASNMLADLGASN